MREEIITRYVAYDGKVFDDEYKCREYEGSLYAKDVSFFDFTSFGDIRQITSVSEAIDCCEIIVIKSVKGAEFVNKCFEDNRLRSPFYKMNKFKTGVFVYNEDKDEWYDWGEYFKLMTDKNEQIMKLLDV